MTAATANAADPPATGGPPAAELIASAELAAERIRESARREAERIIGERSGQPRELSVALLAAVKRQRQTLAVLAAEAERIDQSAEILRAQIRLLDAEIQRTYELLGASPRPVLSTLPNGPGASPDTSLRPHG